MPVLAIKNKTRSLSTSFQHVRVYATLYTVRSWKSHVLRCWNIYLVKLVFQWDLQSLRKMTASYKILDVKKATLALYHKGLPCLQIGSKKSIAKFAHPVFECLPHFEIDTWNASHFASFLLKYFINASKTNLWNYPFVITNLIGECQTESEFLQVWGSTEFNIDFSEKVFCFSNFENIINLCL